MKRFILILTLIATSLSTINCGGDDDPPGPVTLTSPANNKVCEEGIVVSNEEREVTFTWDTATDTETYDLTITNLTSNQPTLKAGLTTTSTKVNLKKGTPYSWVVVSRSSKNPQTGTSPTWKLYVSSEGITNYAPFPATINAPKSGASVTPINNKVTLDWTGSDLDSNTLTYTIFFDKIDGKQPPKSEYTNLTVQKIDVTVDANTIYYWKVKTSDGQNSSETIVYTFRTN